LLKNNFFYLKQITAMRNKMYLKFFTVLVAMAIGFATTTTGQTLFTIGDSTSLSTAYSYPTPYGDYYKTMRTQFLYLADEMVAAGMGAGEITEITFWVGAGSDPGLTEGVTVSMMNTASTTLAAGAWEAGASVVWGPYDNDPTAGAWNTFVFDTPFYWDGSSNIVVEICGGSDLGSYTSNGIVALTTGLDFNGSRTYRTDGATAGGICSYTGTLESGVTTDRPVIRFMAAEGEDCTGTPDAGSASASAVSVCADELFTVSVTPVLAGGITYQWEVSTDGSSWSAIAGAVSASYSTTQSAASWYRCIVTCTASGESSTSLEVFVDQNDPLECYCTPVYSYGTSGGDYCSYVGLGDISNATDGAPAPYYTYYDDMSTDLNFGLEYGITVTSGSYSSSNGLAAWIDFNQNGSFADEGELLGYATGLGAFTSETFYFTVPLDAAPGTTRLRVREVYAMGTPDPCADASFGETEDYNVNLMAGAAFDVAVTEITSPSSGADIGYADVIITVTNYGSEDATGFALYYNVDGGLITGGTFTDTLSFGESASYTFPEGWTFSDYDCFDVVAWCEFAGDENTGNDTLSKNVCNLGPVTGTDAYMIYSNVNSGFEPWTVTSNTDAMNTVFGEGGWSLGFFEEVDPNAVFSSSTCFVFLDGSDMMADELESFLSANLTLIESWVSSGGHLFLNAAPNEGDGMDFGFDGISLNYPYYTSIGEAADSHPIFDGPYTPVGTSWTGSSFGHATVEGPGMDTLIVDQASTDMIVLGEKGWGDGTVLFGGMTPNYFHTPTLESANLRANIIAYLACAAEPACDPVPPTDLYVDGITATDATFHWTPAPGTDVTRIVLWELSTGEVHKYLDYGGDVFNVPGELTPSTTYGVRMRSGCTGDEPVRGTEFTEWYYFTTASLRTGEFTQSVGVYPNPNDGNFRIQLNGYESGKAQVMIMNSVGQLVYEASVSVDSNVSVHDVSLRLAAGTYFVKVINGADIVTSSIIVE